MCHFLTLFLTLTKCTSSQKWHKRATFWPLYHSVRDPKNGTNVPLFDTFLPLLQRVQVPKSGTNVPIFGQFTKGYKIPKVAQLCHFLATLITTTCTSSQKWHKRATLWPIYHSLQDSKSGTNVPFLTLFCHFDKVYKFPKVAQTCHFLANIS